MKNTDKRIIPAVTAFCLALGTMNAGAFNSAEDKVQAETEAVIAPAVTASTSETASLPKNRKGTYRIEAREEFTATNGILTVSYNQNEVSLRDIRLCDSLKNAMTYTKVDVLGKIVIGFVADKPISFKDNMIDIDFDFVSGQVDSIYNCFLRVEELETEDDNGTVQDISQNSLICGSNIFPSIGMAYSPENYGYASYCLSASSNCGFTNGVFTIEYDPETLEYTEVKGYGAFAESMVDAYVIKPGLIKCTVISDKTIYEDGLFLNLRFKILKDGTTEISHTILELNDVVSENDIAEYRTGISRGVTINVKVGSPAPEVSKIPSLPYTQPYVTKAPPVTPRTEPAVTTADASWVSEAPVVTTVAAPETSEAPAATTVAEPETSEVPSVTTIAAPEISEAPEVTTVVEPETSEVPDVTTEDASVTTPSPSVTLPVEQGTVAGDINGDDSVTSRDLITLIKMILGTEKQSASSDLNGDGKTDSADLLELKKILAK